MKKITFEINNTVGEKGAKEICSALNALSGIVAADAVPEDGRAYAYTGDLLEEYTASGAIRDAGYNCRVLGEEYITDVEEYKKSLFPTRIS